MPTVTTYSVASPIESLQVGVSGIRRLYMKAANLDRFGIGMLRLGLVIVLIWIGGLKFASYEADSIVAVGGEQPVHELSVLPSRA